jgi:hypothetical protein
MRQLCVFSIQFPLQNLMERDDVKSGFSFNYSCRGIFVTFMKSSYIYIYIYIINPKKALEITIQYK